MNLGPVLVLTGSLSGLLWFEAARREGLTVTAWDYARVGAAVGLPALVAATAPLALLA
ncbi:hypothetical protein BH24ACT3_BH24ACT3_17870 [soil metagenome]